jgi:hypothetical protein
VGNEVEEVMSTQNIKLEVEVQLQYDDANVLAKNLILCGHDDISDRDLLDCLASVGLKLAPDSEGVAFKAYRKSLGL